MLDEWPGWRPPRYFLVFAPDAEHEDLSLCLACGGRGRGCEHCHGSGHTCPTCRGVRFLSKPWSQERPNSSVRDAEERCPDCRTASQEADTIVAYQHRQQQQEGA